MKRKQKQTRKAGDGIPISCTVKLPVGYKKASRYPGSIQNTQFSTTTTRYGIPGSTVSQIFS